MIKICEICGKVMDKKDYPHYSYLQFQSRRFCSKQCQWKDEEYKNKMREIRKKIKVTEEQIEQCKGMGEANKGKHRSLKTEYKSGKEHPNWKGGTEKYRGKDWKQQKQRALDRDKICQRCGSNKMLDVHHIIPYRKSKDNSLDNLITFCRRCHIIHERGYSTLVIEGDDIIINHVPKKVIKEFYEFAEKEFGGETGLALKWLMDFREGLLSNPNQILSEQIEVLSNEIIALKEQNSAPKEKKIIKSVSGKVISEKEE